MSSHDSYPKIWKVVRKIPRGCVATYGQVAKEAGLPRQARLAGYALHRTPLGMKLPWHRVINAQGRISFPVGTEQHEEQRRLLEQEGVIFSGGRVSLTRYQWRRGAVSQAPVLD
ncbi:MAG: MGMT family protein [Stenotrophobium sp.]